MRLSSDLTQRPWFSRKLLVVGIVLPVILFFLSVLALAPNAPWWDEYSSTIGYLSYPAPERFCHLLDFHNEHRLFFPRLVFEALNLIPGRFPFLVCILVGDCLLLSYVALLGATYRRAFGLVCFLPFIWIFLDLANCENTLWGLTAIQSHSVLLFSLASTLAFARREARGRFVLSLLLALLATASSASGLGIWPTLGLVSLVGARPWRTRLRELSIVGLVGVVVVGLYMKGFFAATSEHTADYPWSVPKAIDFLLCFLGNVAPIAALARALGVVSLVATAYVLFNWRRIADEPMFAFFLYLHTITASGVLVRSCLPGAGLYYRLEIIAISIFCCEAYLVMRLLSGTRLFSWMHKLMLYGIPAAVVVNLLALSFGASFLLDRKREIESGYRAWPADRTRLPAPDVKFADLMMQRYVDRLAGGN